MMSTQHQTSHRIAVSGGGHIGLLAAIAAAHAGYPVTVVDPMPQAEAVALPFDGRGLAVMANKRPFLEELGLWDALATEAIAIQHVRVFEGRSGDLVEWHADQVGADAFCYGMTTAGLRRKLCEVAAGKSTISLLTDRVKGIRRDSHECELALASGDDLTAQLLIGCDGKRSKVASMIGLKPRRLTYGQSAATFALRSTDFASDRIDLFLRAEGPLAILPIADETVSVTWTDSTETLESLGEAGTDAVLKRLGDIYQQNGLSFPDRTSLVGKWQLWPVAAHCHDRMTSPRVALAGDAAHSVHPILAQGFNLGVGDIEAMTNTLFSSGSDDPGGPSRLRAYQKDRARTNSSMVRLTDLSAQIVMREFGLLESLRRPVFNAIGKIAPLHRAIAALGTSSIRQSG